MEFWYIWARIAIAEADKSASARGMFGTTANSVDDSRALDDELNSGVVAVCAVAFSLEALTLLLTSMVMPNTTVQAWTASRTNTVSRLRETLKRSIALPGKDTELLIKSAEPIIAARGAAVHYIGEFEHPVPHPAALQSHPDMITYGEGKASEAVRAMRAIYRALVEHPKPAVHAWVEQEDVALRQLAGLAAT
jgi:hypothetical protein